MKRKLEIAFWSVWVKAVRFAGYRLIRAQDEGAKWIRVYLKGVDVTDFTTACWVPVQPGKTRRGWVDLIGTKEDRTARAGPDGTVVIQRCRGRVRGEWE